MIIKLDQWLIGFLLFSVFIVASVFIIGDINTNYNIAISTDEFNDTYNTIDSMYNISQDQQDKVLGGDLQGDDALDSAVQGSFSAARLVKNTFTLVGDIMNDLARVLNVPSFFVKFAMTAIVIGLIFGIITLFLRFRQ